MTDGLEIRAQRHNGVLYLRATAIKFVGAFRLAVYPDGRVRAQLGHRPWRDLPSLAVVAAQLAEASLGADIDEPERSPVLWIWRKLFEYAVAEIRDAP